MWQPQSLGWTRRLSQLRPRPRMLLRSNLPLSLTARPSQPPLEMSLRLPRLWIPRPWTLLRLRLPGISMTTWWKMRHVRTIRWRSLPPCVLRMMLQAKQLLPSKPRPRQSRLRILPLPWRLLLNQRRLKSKRLWALSTLWGSKESMIRLWKTPRLRRRWRWLLFWMQPMKLLPSRQPSWRMPHRRRSLWRAKLPP